MRLESSTIAIVRAGILRTSLVMLLQGCLFLAAVRGEAATPGSQTLEESTVLRTGMSALRPNILWLVSEDNGTFLGCYGDPLAHTPTLDRLASQGVLFAAILIMGRMGRMGRMADDPLWPRTP